MLHFIYYYDYTLNYFILQRMLNNSVREGSKIYYYMPQIHPL